jgi:hypothetical protein
MFFGYWLDGNSRQVLCAIVLPFEKLAWSLCSVIGMYGPKRHGADFLLQIALIIRTWLYKYNA